MTGGNYITGTTNFLELQPGNSEYIISDVSLNNALSPITSNLISHFIWVYPTGDGIITDEIGGNNLSAGWHDSQVEIVGGQVNFRVRKFF